MSQQLSIDDVHVLARGLDFIDEWKELLVESFHEFNEVKEITVVDSLSGYSDESTWQVSTQDQNGNSRIYAVKIGKRKRIENEYGKFNVAGGLALYGQLVTHEDLKFQSGSDWAMIRSSLAGTEPETLLEYLLTESSDDVGRILSKVFTTNNKWNENKSKDWIIYEEYYDRFLFEHFRLHGLNGHDRNAIPVSLERLSRRPEILYEELKAAQTIKLEDFIVDKHADGILTLCPRSVEGKDTTFRPKAKYILAKGQSVSGKHEDSRLNLYGQNPETRHELLKECIRGTALPGFNPRVRDKTFTSRRGAKLRFPDPIAHLQDLLNKKAQVWLALNHGDLNLQNILILREPEEGEDEASHVDSVLFD